MTPKQLFEIVKQLYPTITRIHKNPNSRNLIQIDKEGSTDSAMRIECDVDWGVTSSYPEPQWRDPIMPYDWNKEARFSDNGKDWIDGVICGKALVSVNGFCWWSGKGTYKFCQIKKDL